MTANLTRTTLFSAADNNIFSVTNNRNNIADPKNRGANGKFVYRNDPWSKGQDYQSYPYIILRFPQIEKENPTIDANTKDVSFTQEFTVRTLMGGAVNNSTGNSAAVTDMQDIVDDLNQTFDSKVVKDSLRTFGIYNLNIDVTSHDEVVDDNNKHIFITELELKYDTRLTLGQ